MNSAGDGVVSTPLPSNDDAVIIDREGPIAWVTMNRPEVLNAMNGQLMDELREALAVLTQERRVRCVVLRGAGRAFSSGGDLRMMAERREQERGDIPTGQLMEEHHRDLLRRSEASVLLATMPKPTLAVLHGHVVGGGLALALACDFRIAGAGAKLRSGFANNGLSGDFGIAYFLNAALGGTKAREILMLDPVISASEALELGLVTAVHADAGLAAEANAFAHRIADGPTLAFGRMKDNLRAARSMSLGAAMEVEALNQRVAAVSVEAVEAGQAFGSPARAAFGSQ